MNNKKKSRKEICNINFWQQKWMHNHLLIFLSLSHPQKIRAPDWLMICIRNQQSIDNLLHIREGFIKLYKKTGGESRQNEKGL